MREQVQKARNFNLTDELEKSIDPDGGVRKTLAVEDFTTPAQQPKPTENPAVAKADPSGEDIADLASAATAPAPVVSGGAAPDAAAATAAAASINAEPTLPTEPTKDKTP